MEKKRKGRETKRKQKEMKEKRNGKESNLGN